MTLLATRSDPAQPPAARRGSPWENFGLLALLSATAVLYLWNLSASGWANGFYSAAVQAGSTNVTALLFGSSDGANSITVDKPPAALWLTGLSVRLFGLHPWSVLAPQALAGVAAVGLLFAAVRRVSGPGGALLAGAVFASTPVATLMFRYNNPDALLVLLLVCAAYCVQRACEPDAKLWWLTAAGVLVGFGFLTKMFQAFLVLPGFAAAYLVVASPPLWVRLRRLALAGIAVAVSAGWYLALVSWWPAGERPYIGGSQHDSILELTFGYNGLGRLTGAEVGGLGNPNFDVGWTRLFDHGMGAEIAWLIPAALICAGAAAWWSSRKGPTTAALLSWGTWLAVTAVVLSYGHGIIHPYYAVALAPAIAALIGIGVPVLWARRRDAHAAVALSGLVLVTTVLACVLLARQGGWLPQLRFAVAVCGVGTAVLMLLVGRLARPAAQVIALVAVAACLAAPAAYSVATAATPHSGALPSSGPSWVASSGPSSGMRGPFGSPDAHPDVAAALLADADRFTWTAAIVGSDDAAGYQLATRTPVLPVGGYNGTDPSPTCDQFRQYVRDKRIHYFVATAHFGPPRAGHGGSDAAADITAWVTANFPSRRIGGVTVYDLTAPTR